MILDITLILRKHLNTQLKINEFSLIDQGLNIIKIEYGMIIVHQNNNSNHKIQNYTISNKILIL